MTPLEAMLPTLQRVVKEVGIPGMWRYNGIMVLSKGPQLAIKVGSKQHIIYFLNHITYIMKYFEM